MSSSPPPPPDNSSSDDLPQPTSSTTGAHAPSTRSPTPPHPPHNLMSMFSFTIMPESGPSGNRANHGGNGGEAQRTTTSEMTDGAGQPVEDGGPGQTNVIWTFHITPEPEAQPSNPTDPAPFDAHTTTFDRPAQGPGSRDTPPNNLADGSAPPLPWILPPFFNFFMPRSESQPDPEKAAELLRSLPTVGRGLLKRVNRIVTAQEVEVDSDEEKGWKCGICLEGLDQSGGDEKEQKGTGVKVLPCNHLYHESCLEPWFTTKHSCPACRLDLDPLQTLHNRPDRRRNPLRPTATGSGRAASPHPYARDSSTPTPSGNATGATDTTTEPPHRQPNASHHAHFSFFWTIPSRPTSPASNLQASPQPAPAQNESAPSAPAHPTPIPTTPAAGPAAETDPSASSELPDPARLAAPRTPPPLFGLQTFASPLAMDGQASPAVPPTQPLTEAGDSITGALPHQHAASDPLLDNRPRPERRPHFTFHRDSPNFAPGAGVGFGAGIPFTPFMINHPESLPFHVPHREPTPAPSAEKREVTPFVPQSLESWTEEREKILGWRCDAPECLFAPPTGADDDMDMDAEAVDGDNMAGPGKEMINIYSSLQPPRGVPNRSTDSNGLQGDTEINPKPFVILSCPHRWHRSCLDTAERSAGRMYKRPDEEGREWVRCERCRKDGWVLPIDDVNHQAEEIDI